MPAVRVAVVTVIICQLLDVVGLLGPRDGGHDLVDGGTAWALQPCRAQPLPCTSRLSGRWRWRSPGAECLVAAPWLDPRCGLVAAGAGCGGQGGHALPGAARAFGGLGIQLGVG
jgi:hypothetical protein